MEFEIGDSNAIDSQRTDGIERRLQKVENDVASRVGQLLNVQGEGCNFRIVRPLRIKRIRVLYVEVLVGVRGRTIYPGELADDAVELIRLATLVPVMSVIVNVLLLPPDMSSTLPLFVIEQPGLPLPQPETFEKLPLPVKLTTAAFACEVAKTAKKPAVRDFKCRSHKSTPKNINCLPTLTFHKFYWLSTFQTQI